MPLQTKTDQSIFVHKGPILYVPPDGDGMVVSSGWMIGEEAEVAIRCDHHQERSLVPQPAKKGEMTRVLQLLMALSSFSFAFHSCHFIHQSIGVPDKFRFCFIFRRFAEFYGFPLSGFLFDGVSHGWKGLRWQ